MHLERDQAETSRQEAVIQESAKKEYRAPTLTEHGSVGELTQATGPFAPDGIIGFSVVSDREAKRDFATVDVQSILSRISALPIGTWSYQAQRPSVRHIGPMAQDFAAAFGFGESDKRIDVVDASGVAMAAIQALHSLVQDQQQQLAELRSELDALKGLQRH